MANLLINLGEQLAARMENNAQIKDFSERVKNFQKSLPNIVSDLKDLKVNYFELRKKISRKLLKDKRRSKLALETLGWGGIFSFLESAFCGDILDVWS